MIYEIRTYNIKPAMVPDYQERFAEKLKGRLGFSPLAAHLYTEIGPINQVVAIWPYDSIDERRRIRAEAEDAGVWPPDTGDLVVSMVSDLYTPAPFMRPLSPGSLGPIYELRTYTYPPEDIPEILRAWGDRIEAREGLSPLIGCWYRESGGTGNFAHMWAYRTFEERMRVRQEARERDIWPPPTTARLVTQESKILLPASFSPLQ